MLPCIFKAVTPHLQFTANVGHKVFAHVKTFNEHVKKFSLNKTR